VSHPDVLAPPGEPASELAFLKSVLASSADCIKVLDLEGNLVFMTDAGQVAMEVSDFNLIRGCPWPDFWQGGLNDQAREAVALARAGGQGRFVGSTDTMAGTSKWWDVRVTPIRGADGLPAQLLAVSRDITLQKKAEEQQQLLAMELSHRVKNILSVVQAIAGMSLGTAPELAAARAVFEGRLFALARAQDVMLARADDAQATIRRLLAHVQAVEGTRRITCTGPDIEVGSRFALAFSLVTHELFTNALKYGALSNALGTVTVSWEPIEVEGEPYLSLAWVEQGGPDVATPSRRGFGTRLIERSMAKGQRSSAVMDFRQAGLVYALKTSMASLVT
jgi:PAS domain S-box-containing protein